MVSKVIFIVQALVLGVSAVLYLFFTEYSLNFYGLTLVASVVLMARMFGVLHLGNAIMSWMGRDHAGSPAGRAMMWAWAVAWGMAGVVVLNGVLAGTMNAFGWGIVAMSVAFMFAFLYLLVTVPEEVEDEVYREQHA